MHHHSASSKSKHPASDHEIQTGMNRKQVGRKMMLLRYELNTLTDKIGKSRDEDVSFSLQKDYETKLKDYNFLKELKRRFQSSLAENHKFARQCQSPKQSQHSFSFQQRYQTQPVQYDAKPKISKIGPQLSNIIKQKMEQKFLEFCKSKSSPPPYFSEIEPENRVMKYKVFLLFTKQAGLEDIVTFEERLRIFNKHSKFKKRLLFEQFYAALEDCCKIICQRHQNRYSKHNFRLFLTNLLTKLQISFITPKNHSIKKLEMHTGLLRQSMQDQLDDSRKHFEEKRAGSILKRNRLLAKIKDPFPLPSRSASMQKHAPSMIMPLSTEQISAKSFKRVEPDFISYTSLMKNRPKQKKQLQIISINSRKDHNKQSYQNEISSLVDLDEPDTMLEQILSKNFNL